MSHSVIVKGHDGQLVDRSKQVLQKTVKVWDPLLRIFHWTLVISFFIALASEDDFLDVHVYAGYLLMGLIGFRLIWGLIGPKHARFIDFIKGPKETLTYARDMITGSAKRHIGHNPLGGLMILALLSSLSLTTFTGLVVYGLEENAGPLASITIGPVWMEDLFEEVHEFFANFTLTLVFFHVMGVVISSLLHRENLVLAMFTGRKKSAQ